MKQYIYLNLIKELFGKVKLYQLRARVDNRGTLAYVIDQQQFKLLEEISNRLEAVDYKLLEDIDKDIVNE